ncbi:MAG TPA: hypothetical protein VF188_17975 [Longimicrobiales bacterium]
MPTSRVTILIASMLLLPACSAVDASLPEPATRLSFPSEQVAEGITFHAELRVVQHSPLVLQTVVTATNAGTRTRRVEVPGGCPVLVRVYQNPHPLGEPAWDQAEHTSCAPQLTTLTLEPGESRELQTTVAAREILGRVLPSARYHLTAVVRPNGEWIELSAGDTVLTRQRGAEPSGEPR